MNSSIHRLGGIILAGGASRRMGRPKAWLDFAGEPMLCRVARCVQECARPVIIATRRGLDLPPTVPTARVVFDEDIHAGPLAGIVAGMRALKGLCDNAVVVGCDHPFLVPALIARMLECLGDHQAVMPRVDGKLFTTLAIYRMDALLIAEQFLNDGEFRARRFAEQCKPRCLSAADMEDVDPLGSWLLNLNHPEDYFAALEIARTQAKEQVACAH